MTATLKWALHIEGDDLYGETTALIELLTTLKARGLPAPASFTTTHADLPPSAQAVLPLEPVIGLPPELPAEFEPAKRTRRHRARTADPVVDEFEPEAEPEEAAPTKANGALAEFAHLTGAEAREQGLVYLRLSYAAPDGGAEEVKALQKKLKIAKFTDVPDAEGHALLAEAIKIAAKFGLVTS